jgi:2,4-diaminopentanoate dehydrogenase
MRVCMIGTGFHGRRVARLVSELGGEVVAAVSAGDEIGRTIESAPIGAEVSAELDRVDSAVDVAIVIVPGPASLEEQLAGPCLDRGVNLLTLSPEAFHPPPDWAERMDRRAKEGGASMLATGVQDLWWVHIPAAAASMVTNLSGIALHCVVNIGELSAGVAFAIEVGGEPRRFPAVRERLSAGAPILGGALAALGRRLDLGGGKFEANLEPVLAEQALRHAAAGVDVAPGTLAGVVERTHLTTESGVVLEGELVSRLLPDGESACETILVRSDPALRLVHAPFPGTRVTDVAAVARLPDVVAAPPGLLDVARLPPPSHCRTLV